ncbi:MAG: rhomboid family intramembrane serine protease [Planctomycetota bacterium]|nr:MAG: rhomboid family intramembrane serine protease [Planctomycetota bacterium]
MLIIPWKVDVPQDRWPVANYLIIALCVAVFVLVAYLFYQMYAEQDEEGVDKVVCEPEAPELIKPYVLEEFSVTGLFGHIWLHAGPLHLLGNMLFLWVFGNAVCSKLGNIVYLPVYLVLGAFAGLAHLAFQGGAAVGASGAINGVVGMYLAFFPQNDVSCVFIMWLPFALRPYVRAFTISGYWVILFWLAFDIWGMVRGGGGVAYFAHGGGFAAGFLFALLMLKMRWVVMDRWERSILQILTERKQPVQEEYRGDLGRYGVLAKELEAEEKVAAPIKEKRAAGGPVREKVREVKAPATVTEKHTAVPVREKERRVKMPPAEPVERRKDEFIRFVCVCGKRVKVPRAHAGKVGRCPGCGKGVRVPG